MARHLTTSGLLALLLVGCPPEPVSIASFVASRDLLNAGESTTLSWTSHGARFCRLEPEPGTVDGAGSVVVTPEATTTYGLTCGTLRKAVTVTVRRPARILSFTASPQRLAPDGVVSFAWQTAEALECLFSPGSVVVPSNGARTESPTADTTFTLSCVGATGPVSQSLRVAVVPVSQLATPTDVTLTPGDGTLTVTWTQEAGAGVVAFAAAAGFDAGTVEQLPEGRLLTRVRSPLRLTGLRNEQPYWVRVGAISGAVTSGLTPEQSATPHAAPPENDPYFALQWHLFNPSGADLDVLGPWDAGLRGEGQLLAVVDEGVDLAHEDLAQNVAVGWSINYLADATLDLAVHGTSVAGLLAARDWNGKGVRGVVPRAAFVSYDVLQDATSANQFDAMTRHEAAVTVSNNSWGDPDGTGLLTTSDPLWLSGVTEGTTLGRHGLGTLYFWAAGNGGDAAYRDLSSYDGQANRRFVFAVAGVDSKGGAIAYSERGPNVLVAAPTGGEGALQLVTTDVTGAFGYNGPGAKRELPDLSYTRTFDGTSAATPLAAGVGALVLQARPELSWRDVRRVLAYSAKQLDPADPGWATNGAGLHVNDRCGFGLVDAQAAVAMARVVALAGPEVVFHGPVQRPGAPLVEHQPTSSTVTVAGSGITQLEWVEVVLSVDHPRTGDLRVVLSRAGGVSDLFHEPHACQPDTVTQREACAPLDAYPFGSTRHLDEPGDGEWTLTVTDEVTGNTGTLTAWHLTLYGH